MNTDSLNAIVKVISYISLTVILIFLFRSIENVTIEFIKASQEPAPAPIFQIPFSIPQPEQGPAAPRRGLPLS